MQWSEPQLPTKVLDRAEVAWGGRRRLGFLRRRMERFVPHRVFTADLQAIANRESVEGNTRFVGWQLLIPGPDDPVAIEVSEGGDVQIERGPLVEGVRRVFHSVQELGSASGEELSARVLRVPEMGLMAVWISSPEGTQDIVPVAPAPPRLDPFHHYDVKKFFDCLSELARKQLAAYAEAPQEDELG